MENIPVYLDEITAEHGGDGGTPSLEERISGILDDFLPGSLAGQKVLVKPNLLKAGEHLCVTSPDLIVSVSRQVMDRGGRLTVADSPAFGSAEKVLGFLGILEELRNSGARVCSLKRPVRVHLPCGIRTGISKTALGSDLIINIPRFKAHCQMGATGAVKNAFGTVVGFRKALAHTLHGKNPATFAGMILEINQVLPPVLSIVDARVIMHKTGPSGGLPYPLGLISASPSPVAVDTCMYHALDLVPEQVPLWKEARRRVLPGSDLEDLSFTRKSPLETNPGHQLIMPETLEPITFNLSRFLKGRIRSLLKRLF